PLDVEDLGGVGLPNALTGENMKYRDFRGFRAEGGGTEKGKAYVIGEKGPELFVPKEDGTVVPNHYMGRIKDIVNPSEEDSKKVVSHSLQSNLRMGGKAFVDDMISSGMIDGAREDGGPVRAGDVYLVGERGPEAVLGSTYDPLIHNNAGLIGALNSPGDVNIE